MVYTPTNTVSTHAMTHYQNLNTLCTVNMCSCALLSLIVLSDKACTTQRYDLQYSAMNHTTKHQINTKLHINSSAQQHTKTEHEVSPGVCAVFPIQHTKHTQHMLEIPVHSWYNLYGYQWLPWRLVSCERETQNISDESNTHPKTLQFSFNSQYQCSSDFAFNITYIWP